MEKRIVDVLWNQFGAAIDMLENAITVCPEPLWTAQLWENPNVKGEFSQLWYLAYHALFWLDFYLTGTLEGFTPPAPFTLAELDPTGLLPEKPYTKVELQAYLKYCRSKCMTTIGSLTDESAWRLCKFPSGEINFLELQLYNMRHVQEHGAQLNLMLGQNGVEVKGWVKKARNNA